MKSKINTFPSTAELTEAICNEFHQYIGKLCAEKSQVNVVLSGGNTPNALFKKLSAYRDIPGIHIDWNKVHFFWGDERCVPPDHPESNFGMANRYFLKALEIPGTNIHRIRGEDEPQAEAKRYAAEILDVVLIKNNLPVFNWIFLGMGDDGHTASIFPDRLNLLYSNKICEVASHPITGQNRITLTGKPIINAERITFMVTGATKSKVLRNIIHDDPQARMYPARFIRPTRGILEWYVDKDAAREVGK